MATTVAGDDPETAAKIAQATTAAMPSPPGQWPTMAVAKRIMRFATPPWVRKLPARMKNGTHMISKLSMPVKSFRATASSGTEVSVKRNVRTVRPSAIDTGMPVRSSAASSAKMMSALIAPSRRRRTGVDAFDVAGIVLRQLARSRERPRDLQEAEAHQVRAERDREVDDPHRQLEHGARSGPSRRCASTSRAPERADDGGEERAGERARTGRARGGGRAAGA